MLFGGAALLVGLFKGWRGIGVVARDGDVKKAWQDEKGRSPQDGISGFFYGF